MKERSKARVDKILGDFREGRITKAKAAALLKVSERTVTRLRKRQEADKDNYLVHGNTGRKSPRKTPEEVAGRIEELYAGKYSGFGFSHFRDMLEEREKMPLPLSTTIAVLKSRGFQSPYCNGPRRKKKEHPLRPRRARFGELVQVDATFYDFFSFAGDHEVYILHGIIDDATEMILALWMDRRETLDGYRHVLLKMLKKHGIYEEWYTDGRTVFCHGFDENGEPRGSPAGTQFARWCRDLGITLLCTPVPQAKGRIERSWGTLKRRWAKEFPLFGIRDMETFNARSDEIAEKHNAKFAVRPRIDDSRFVPIMMPDEELVILLSIRHRRTVHKGCCVQYDNKKIQLIKDDGTVLELGSKAEIEVRLTSDGEIYGCYDHKYHRTRTVEEVTDDIASFFPSAREMNEGKSGGKKGHKASADHPWRHMKI